jgi:hypothetical protein
MHCHRNCPYQHSQLFPKVAICASLIECLSHLRFEGEPLKPEAKLDHLKNTLQGLLPEDGTPVLNRVMRIMLARKLERAIDEETFFKARDQLLEEGKVGRLRGQGGQIFLNKQSVVAKETKITEEIVESWPESKLMEPLKNYLEGPFRKNLDLPANSAFIVHNTSSIGSHKGKWARPDFIVVSAMRFKYLPGAQVDLHSFELKTETGGSVLAIHEALAQTRFTHFGHFVWHLPNGSKNEAKLEEIINHCDEHGIGLIRIRDPERVETFEILVDPRRKPTLPATVDGFLESRLSDSQKQILLKSISGGVA